MMGVCQTQIESKTIARNDYSFQNLFLGPNKKRFEGYKYLISDGQQYAEYFGVKSVDSEKNFGMPKEDMYAILIEVNKIVASSEFDHNPTNWKYMPSKLTKVALETAFKKAKELGYSFSDRSHKADFEYFVQLRAIQEWVMSRMDYSQDEASGKIKRTGGFNVTMSMQRPSTICGGLSWAIVYFATTAGLDNVFKLEGSSKTNDGKSNNFDHSWNAAILPSGSVVFTDPTRNYYAIEYDIKSRNGITFSPFGFGIESWSTGFFLNYYHSQTVIAGKKAFNDVMPSILTQNSKQFGTVEGADYFTSQKFQDWVNLKTPSSFHKTCGHYFFNDKAR